MVVAHYLNSKDFDCIQAVERTEIGSLVVLVCQRNCKDFNCIQVVKLTEIGSEWCLLII